MSASSNWSSGSCRADSGVTQDRKDACLDQVYTSLPDAWSRQSQRRKTLLTVNDVSIPLVPALCFLLFVVGLPCWMSGMMMARAATNDIFSDLHITPQSIEQLKAAVFWAVIVIPPVFVLVLAANTWLEIGSSSSSEAAPGPAASTYAANSYRINIANWGALLLSALVMAGTVTWLFNTSVTLSAVKSAGGGGWPPSPWSPPAAALQLGPAAPAPAATHSIDSIQQKLDEVTGSGEMQQQQWQKGPSQQGMMGSSAVHVWLLDGLVDKLQHIVRQLSLAVAGAAMLFMATSWLFGYLAAQAAHAERDWREVVQPRSVAAA